MGKRTRQQGRKHKAFWIKGYGPPPTAATAARLARERGCGICGAAIGDNTYSESATVMMNAIEWGLFIVCEDHVDNLRKFTAEVEGL